MLTLYGHPFSAYTWKVRIALLARGIAHELRVPGPQDDAATVFVARHGGPLGRFPVLADGERTFFESTSIIDYLDRQYPTDPPLIPRDADAAILARTLDRVFDNAVMAPMQAVVAEHLRAPGAPDGARRAEARGQLDRAYGWLERWLSETPPGDAITLVECAAAPALFYADWVHRIPDITPKLQAWRAHLLALAAVAQCVDEARPYRGYFPPGAPDRD